MRSMTVEGRRDLPGNCFVGEGNEPMSALPLTLALSPLRGARGRVCAAPHPSPLPATRGEGTLRRASLKFQRPCLPDQRLAERDMRLFVDQLETCRQIQASRRYEDVVGP
jgi:hypothetical protein